MAMSPVSESLNEKELLQSFLNREKRMLWLRWEMWRLFVLPSQKPRFTKATVAKVCVLLVEQEGWSAWALEVVEGADLYLHACHWANSDD